MDWNDLSNAAELKRQFEAMEKLPVFNRQMNETALGKLIAACYGANAIERLYNFIHAGEDRPSCKVCGKPACFKRPLRKYSEWCGFTCASRDPATKSKKQRMIMNKYGVSSIFDVPEVKAKIDQTKLERFGGHQMLDKTVSQKRSDTMLERHGGTALASPEIKAKFFDTMLERYGCTHNWQSQELKDRYLKDRKVRFWVPKIAELDLMGLKPLFDMEHYDGTCQENRWLCTKCDTSFIDKLDKGIPRCPKCQPLMTGVSRAELDLGDFIENELGLEVQRNRRIFPDNSRSIDIVVESKKVAIEYNGLVWHSELGLYGTGKERGYHLTKTKDCAALGYELIHVFEDDYLKNPDLIRSMLKAKLGAITDRRFARSLEVRMIGINETRAFLEANHIQGDVASKIKVGLFDGTQLVAVMTLGKPRYDRTSELELLRWCSLKDVAVIGGFSKVMAFIERRFKPTSIVSYCDLSRSTGKLYEKNGFVLDHWSGLNYWYWCSTEYWKHSRTRFQKSKLKDKLEVFDTALSEWENMSSNGWNRIWDCGSLVFIKRNTYAKE